MSAVAGQFSAFDRPLSMLTQNVHDSGHQQDMQLRYKKLPQAKFSRNG